MKNEFVSLLILVIFSQLIFAQEIKINGQIDNNNNQIKNVADPTDAQDAVTKGYVDTRNVIYNTTIRYLAYNTVQTIEILSTGTIYSGLTWSRSGTTITINSNSHGLSNGDNVVVRNMGDTDYLYSVVSNSSANSFQINNAIDSGDVSGTSGAYIPAAGAYNVSDSGASISSPSIGDIQILAIRFNDGKPRGTNVFQLTMPTGMTNGAGGNNDEASTNPPLIRVNNVSSNSGGGPIFAGYGANVTSSNNVFYVGQLNRNVVTTIRFRF